MYFVMRMSACAALLLLICQLIAAQVPFPRHCPEVKVPETFNTDAYMGIWFEYAKYPHIFEIAKRCMFARYTNKGNNTIGVLNTSINAISGHTTNSTAKARLLAPSQINVLFSKYSGSADTPNYIVLGTDYKSYSVVYNCNNLTSLAHTKLLWIMTRERKPSAEAISAAKKVMDDNNLPQSFLLIADQDNCPAVAPNYGINIQFGVNSSGNNKNNNNINKIDKNTENNAEAASEISDNFIFSSKVTPNAFQNTEMPLATEEIDSFETTSAKTANFVQLA